MLTGPTGLGSWHSFFILICAARFCQAGLGGVGLIVIWLLEGFRTKVWLLKVGSLEIRDYRFNGDNAGVFGTHNGFLVGLKHCFQFLDPFGVTKVDIVVGAKVGVNNRWVLVPPLRPIAAMVQAEESRDEDVGAHCGPSVTASLVRA